MMYFASSVLHEASYNIIKENCDLEVGEIVVWMKMEEINNFSYACLQKNRFARTCLQKHATDDVLNAIKR